MKFTLSWLKDHLETDADITTISETLTMIGLEVEEITDFGERLSPFTVAEVLSAEQHPDADRLKVCQVKTADGEVTVVCGAPNARAGMKAAFAPPGTYVPGIDVTLKVAKIRGVESHGMLCSATELEIGTESDGILDLPAETAVGQPVAEVLGLNDPVIEIALTPNRPDCTGVRGIARDLAAAGLGTLKDWSPKASDEGADSPITVTIEGETFCPQFKGRLIRGVKNGESPAWLKQRLEAIGLRPISALVDITNYSTFDLGRPLHVYDVKKLTGNITVKPTTGGEKLAALNDKTYEIKAGMTGIFDDSKENGGLIGQNLIGLGGIIGGESTGVDETTTDVFVECALFDPIKTAETGRELQLLSDARYRFERGVDPESIHWGMANATDLILDICGGEASAVVTAGNTPDWTRSVELDIERLSRIAGLDIPLETAQEILTNLGFTVNGTTVQPPSFRPDIDGSADLIEEVLRIHGYDKIPATSVTYNGDKEAEALPASQHRAAIARRTLAGRGMLEAVTWSFMDSSLVPTFGERAESLTLLSPISSELDHLRPTIVANLIQAAARNGDRGYPDVALFETGPQFDTDINSGGQAWVAAGLRAGQGPRHWGNSPRPVDAYDAKADAWAVLEMCGAPDSASVSRQAPDYYHPGRSGGFYLGKMPLAVFGEIHPGILTDLDITTPMVAFEVYLENIPATKHKAARTPLKLSPLQPVGRDFAFVVERTVAAEDLVRAVRGVDKNLIQDVFVFDVYEGDNVGENEKSLAIHVTLQPQDKTLTDQDIEALSSQIISQAEKRCAAKLR